MTAASPERILVIKLGALGDFVQALGPFAAIRAHHPDADIVLLTTRPYADLGRASGYFDEVWTDPRVPWWRVGAILALRERLRGPGFSRVYDLQTSDRSSAYRRLFWPGPYPEWSGIAKGCSHPHANPDRDFMHTVERQAEQLAMAGIASVPPPDIAWMETDVSRFGLPGDFALLVPGGAPHRPAKRWPADRYADLAGYLAGRDVAPVVIGGKEEAGLAAAIREKVPATVDLTGKTTLADIAALARQAKAAVGNDTGPIHLIAAAGCPTLVLFSHDSDPALCGQRGPRVDILRVPDLAELGIDEVARRLPLS